MNKILQNEGCFFFRVAIGRKKEETIEACPDILCENVKEAEHLGCTLALYQLCKGQVRRLLISIICAIIFITLTLLNSWYDKRLLLRTTDI